MKRLLFFAPIILTFLVIAYTLKVEDTSNEGVIVGLGIMYFIATIEVIAYSMVLIFAIFEKFEKTPSEKFGN